jgi:hypothetical protein
MVPVPCPCGAAAGAGARQCRAMPGRAGAGQCRAAAPGSVPWRRAPTFGSVRPGHWPGTESASANPTIEQAVPAAPAR